MQLAYDMAKRAGRLAAARGAGAKPTRAEVRRAALHVSTRGRMLGQIGRGS